MMDRTLRIVVGFSFASVVFLISFAVALSQSGTRWYVSVASRTSQADGSSWARAFPVLDSAFHAAKPGDEIWVAQGTYKPSTTGLEQRRLASFLLPSEIAIYGGFIGNETALSMRPVNGKSTLSGDIGATITNQDNREDVGYYDNVYHVVRAEQGISGTLLDGFIIEFGYAGAGFDIYNNPNSRGGGIYVEGDVVLRNLDIRYNQGAHQGGGLYLASGTATACRIHHNRASKNIRGARGFGSGGGAYLHGGTLANSLVYANQSLRYGGGVHVDKGRLLNMTIYNNTSTIGGGVYIDHDAHDSAVIANLVLDANKATYAIWGDNFYNEKVDGKGVTLKCVLSPGGRRVLLKGTQVIRAVEATLYRGEANFLSIDPLDKNFLRPSDASPAIDKGDSKVLEAVGVHVAADYEGRMRLQGKEVDLGAYEVR